MNALIAVQVLIALQVLIAVGTGALVVTGLAPEGKVEKVATWLLGLAVAVFAYWFCFVQTGV